MLRRGMVADMHRRFKKLKSDVVQLVDTEDAFGLRVRPNSLQFNERWKFNNDADKVQNYQEWLQGQVDAGILEAHGGDPTQAWTSQYITSAHQKGIVRGYQDAIKKGAIVDDMKFVQGGKAQFLADTFNGPKFTSKVKMLQTRTFTDLKNVTSQMDADMSRILAEGLAAGNGPKKIARDLTKSIDGLERKRALTIARTEIVHAHAEGQLDSFEAMGVHGVSIMAEWSTAGDDRVCPLCQPLEGIMLTIKEARNLIPRHPNCRCAWIPGDVGEDEVGLDEGQIKQPAEVKSQLRKSVQEEHPALSARQAREASRWRGADVSPGGKLARTAVKTQGTLEKATATSRAAFDAATEKTEAALAASTAKAAAAEKSIQAKVLADAADAELRAAAAKKARAAKLAAEAKARAILAEKAAAAAAAARARAARAAAAKKAKKIQMAKDAKAAEAKAAREAKKAAADAKKAADAAAAKAAKEAEQKAAQKAERVAKEKAAADAARARAKAAEEAQKAQAAKQAADAAAAKKAADLAAAKAAREAQAAATKAAAEKAARAKADAAALVAKAKAKAAKAAAKIKAAEEAAIKAEAKAAAKAKKIKDAADAAAAEAAKQAKLAAAAKAKAAKELAEAAEIKAAKEAADAKAAAAAAAKAARIEEEAAAATKAAAEAAQKAAKAKAVAEAKEAKAAAAAQAKAAAKAKKAEAKAAREAKAAAKAEKAAAAKKIKDEKAAAEAIKAAKQKAIADAAEAKAVKEAADAAEKLAAAQAAFQKEHALTEALVKAKALKASADKARRLELALEKHNLTISDIGSDGRLTSEGWNKAVPDSLLKKLTLDERNTILAQKSALKELAKIDELAEKVALREAKIATAMKAKITKVKKKYKLDDNDVFVAPDGDAILSSAGTKKIFDAAGAPLTFAELNGPDHVGIKIFAAKAKKGQTQLESQIIEAKRLAAEKAVKEKAEAEIARKAADAKELAAHNLNLKEAKASADFVEAWGLDNENHFFHSGEQIGFSVDGLNTWAKAKGFSQDLISQIPDEVYETALEAVSKPGESLLLAQSKIMQTWLDTATKSAKDAHAHKVKLGMAKKHFEKKKFAGGVKDNDFTDHTQTKLNNDGINKVLSERGWDISTLPDHHVWAIQDAADVVMQKQIIDGLKKAPKGTQLPALLKPAATSAKTTDAKNAVASWEKAGDVDVLDAADYTDIPGWKPKAQGQSYGVVLVGDDGRVLMREPTGHFGGAHWTFAKGGGKKPGSTALAELAEETGHIGELHDIVPGGFEGTTSKTNYFIGKSKGYDANLMDKETASTKWMTYEEALEAIKLSPSAKVVARDTAVLKAAFKQMKESDGTAFKALAAKAPTPAKAKPKVMTKAKFKKQEYDVRETSELAATALYQKAPLLPAPDVWPGNVSDFKRYFKHHGVDYDKMSKKHLQMLDAWEMNDGGEALYDLVEEIIEELDAPRFQHFQSNVLEKTAKAFGVPRLPDDLDAVAAASWLEDNGYGDLVDLVLKRVLKSGPSNKELKHAIDVAIIGKAKQAYDIANPMQFNVKGLVSADGKKFHDLKMKQFMDENGHGDIYISLVAKKMAAFKKGTITAKEIVDDVNKAIKAKAKKALAADVPKAAPKAAPKVDFNKIDFIPQMPEDVIYKGMKSTKAAMKLWLADNGHLDLYDSVVVSMFDGGFTAKQIRENINAALVKWKKPKSILPQIVDQSTDIMEDGSKLVNSDGLIDATKVKNWLKAHDHLDLFDEVVKPLLMDGLKPGNVEMPGWDILGVLSEVMQASKSMQAATAKAAIKKKKKVRPLAGLDEDSLDEYSMQHGVAFNVQAMDDDTFIAFSAAHDAGDLAEVQKQLDAMANYQLKNKADGLGEIFVPVSGPRATAPSPGHLLDDDGKSPTWNPFNPHKGVKTADASKVLIQVKGDRIVHGKLDEDAALLVTKAGIQDLDHWKAFIATKIDTWETIHDYWSEAELKAFGVMIQKHTGIGPRVSAASNDPLMKLISTPDAPAAPAKAAPATKGWNTHDPLGDISHSDKQLLLDIFDPTAPQDLDDAVAEIAMKAGIQDHDHWVAVVQDLTTVDPMDIWDSYEVSSFGYLLDKAKQKSVNMAAKAAGKIDWHPMNPLVGVDFDKANSIIFPDVHVPLNAKAAKTLADAGVKDWEHFVALTEEIAKTPPSAIWDEAADFRKMLEKAIAIKAGKAVPLPKPALTGTSFEAIAKYMKEAHPYKNKAWSDIPQDVLNKMQVVATAKGGPELGKIADIIDEWMLGVAAPDPLIDLGGPVPSNFIPKGIVWKPRKADFYKNGNIKLTALKKKLDELGEGPDPLTAKEIKAKYQELVVDAKKAGATQDEIIASVNKAVHGTPPNIHRPTATGWDPKIPSKGIDLDALEEGMGEGMNPEGFAGLAQDLGIKDYDHLVAILAKEELEFGGEHFHALVKAAMKKDLSTAKPRTKVAAKWTKKNPKIGVDLEAFQAAVSPDIPFEEFASMAKAAGVEDWNHFLHLFSNVYQDSPANFWPKRQLQKWIGSGAPWPDKAIANPLVKQKAAMAKKLKAASTQKNTIPTPDTLTKIKDLPGSTKPILTEDPTGKRWVVKSTEAGIAPDHLRSEALADELYRRAGFTVPRGRIVDTAEGPSKITEFLEGGETLQDWRRGKSAAEIKAMNKEIQKGFVADSLFANHDVVGLQFDNIFIVKGKPIRIDNGGALLYRAQGAPKARFKAKVIELDGLTNPNINPQAADVFAGITDEEIQDQIEALLIRKDSILAAVTDADLRATLASRFDDLAAKLPADRAAAAAQRARGGVRGAEYVVDAKTAERVQKSRVNGTSIAGDRDQIEDMDILVWQENDIHGKPHTVLSLKVTRKGSNAIEETIGDLMEGADKRAGVDNWGGQMSDPYWDALLKASKTVSYHSVDKAYNEATLKTYAAVKSKIWGAVDSATGAEKAMLEEYLEMTMAIDKAKKKGTKFQPGELKKFNSVAWEEANPDLVDKVKIAPARPKYDVARNSMYETPLVKYDKGNATRTGRKNKVRVDAGAYDITAGDDIQMRFVPRTDKSYEHEGLGLEGSVHVDVPGEATEENIKRALSSIKGLGVSTDAPTAAYEELVYLHKGIYIRNKHNNLDYLKIIADPHASDAEKLADVKDFVQQNMGVDVDKLGDAYRPSGMSSTSFGDGKRHWMRWDLPPEQIEKEMSEYTLQTTVGGIYQSEDASLLMRVDQMLEGGGEMTSTTNRIRKGVDIDDGGDSSRKDINTGGGSYVFSRIRRTAADETLRTKALFFKRSLLARADAVSHQTDQFGQIGQLNKRGNKLNDYKKFALHERGNETNFKNTVSILDDVDFIRMGSETMKKEMVKVFEKHGITTLPDGREVKDIITTMGKLPKAPAANEYFK